MDILQLAALLRSLLQGKYSSLTLSFNESSGPNYQSVADYLDSVPREFQSEWVSEEEKSLARRYNSMWALRWYPHTPVGSCELSASSLEALIAGVVQMCQAEETEL